MKKIFFPLILCLCLYVPQLWATNTSTDECFSRDTALMLHMDGTNLSQNFIDSSVYDSVMTAEVGVDVNAAIYMDTSQLKFGSSSGYFYSGGVLHTPQRASLNLEDSPFTIDFWIRWDFIGANDVIFWKYGSKPQRSWRLLFYPSSGNLAWRYRYVPDTNSSEVGFPLNPVEDTWYHIALTRDQSGDLRCFANGVQIGSTLAMGSHEIETTPEPLYIGRKDSDSYRLHGWLEEVRIIIGIAVWTSNFTPPSNPYHVCTSKSLEGYTWDSMRQSTECENETVSVTDVNSTVSYTKTSKSVYIENTGSTDEAYVDVNDGIATVGWEDEIKLRPGADRQINGFKTTEIGLICDTGESTTVFVETCH